MTLLLRTVFDECWRLIIVYRFSVLLLALPAAIPAAIPTSARAAEPGGSIAPGSFIEVLLIYPVLPYRSVSDVR
jgi:hypothetical protein